MLSETEMRGQTLLEEFPRHQTIFFSPNFPGGQDAISLVEWDFKVLPGKSIKMEVLDLEVSLQTDLYHNHGT